MVNEYASGSFCWVMIFYENKYKLIRYDRYNYHRCDIHFLLSSQLFIHIYNISHLTTRIVINLRKYLLSKIVYSFIYQLLDVKLT